MGSYRSYRMIAMNIFFLLLIVVKNNYQCIFFIIIDEVLINFNESLNNTVLQVQYLNKYSLNIFILFD